MSGFQAVRSLGKRMGGLQLHNGEERGEVVVVGCAAGLGLRIVRPWCCATEWGVLGQGFNTKGSVLVLLAWC